VAEDPSAPGDPLARFDPTRPHSARVWNYWLGGKDNYEADREVGEQVRAQFPGIVDVARHSRGFLGRAGRYLAGEAGIRQFLDIGTGLPTVDNTHEVAQRVAPASRIVYVDNDPLVLAHAQALLTSTPEGACAYLDADVRDPDRILAQAATTLDFTRPTALMMLGILGNVADYQQARAIVKRLVDAVPSGSYLVVNDGSAAVSSEAVTESAQTRAEAGDPYYVRSPQEIAAYLDGLQLLQPGVVSVSRWRPEAAPWGEPEEVAAFCGIARKP
jgi:O-methyltransferase involved in polyketide biosynthesis